MQPLKLVGLLIFTTAAIIADFALLGAGLARIFLQIKRRGCEGCNIRGMQVLRVPNELIRNSLHRWPRPARRTPGRRRAAIGSAIAAAMAASSTSLAANASTRSPRSDSWRLAATISSRTVATGMIWPCHGAREQRWSTTSGAPLTEVKCGCWTTGPDSQRPRAIGPVRPAPADGSRLNTSIWAPGGALEPAGLSGPAARGPLPVLRYR
jgi:hypothetical protein